MQYLNFELKIDNGVEREFLVEVMWSPAGEAQVTMRLPLEERALKNQLLRLGTAGMRPPTGSNDDHQERVFGSLLFDALMIGDVRSLYFESLREATRKGKGLRVRLHIRSPEMAALPWELLYDNRSGQHLALSRNTPVVRYLDIPSPPRSLAVEPPLRLLGMAVSPVDLAPLDTKREKQVIEHATRFLRAKGLLEIVWLEDQTWRGLQEAMRRGHWHLFHFVGHSAYDVFRDQGVLLLADDTDKGSALYASELGELLADHESLRMVVLNSAEGARGGGRDLFSSTAATLVRYGVPAVLAMQFAISDRMAIELCQTFYGALSDGMPVDAAVAEARKSVARATQSAEWMSPVLYMRSPDGVLLSSQPQPTEPVALPRPESNQEPRSQLATDQQASRPGLLVSPALRRDLEVRKDELQRAYDGFTERIKALDTERDQTTDAEKSLTLKNRKTQLESERAQVVAEMARIEEQFRS